MNKTGPLQSGPVLLYAPELEIQVLLSYTKVPQLPYLNYTSGPVFILGAGAGAAAYTL